ncbi:MAG: NAD-binding protein, partial [Eubacterium sp.]|nr:NAD-binding protein [Eubacterium sp.]
IIGGGSMAYYLLKILRNSHVDVKLIERDRKRCEELVEAFPEATITCGDGSDQKLLHEERLDSMDALVACTGIDEVNAILSKYAQGKVGKKIITKLNHIEFDEVIESLELDSVIEPKYLTAQRILQYVRAMAESMDSNVETLYRLVNNRVEALEFIIRPKSRFIGVKLADLKFKPNTIVAGIRRNDNLIIPGGKDSFCEGDAVIVVTTNLGYQDINDIVRTGL